MKVNIRNIQIKTQEKEQKLHSKIRLCNMSGKKSNDSVQKIRKSFNDDEEAIHVNELGPSLPPLTQASKRRMTSQDWVSSRSLDDESEILPLPQGVSFTDIFNEDNPNAFASQSFTESERSFNSSFDSSSTSTFRTSTASFDQPRSRMREKFPYNPLDSSQPRLNEQVSCTPTDLDVLLGRGGMTNNHAGNVRYREEVEKVKPMYFGCKTKNEKKEVSELLVAYVEDYGGRFLQKDPETKEWVLAPPKAARKKASQALRETKWKQPNDTIKEKPD